MKSFFLSIIILSVICVFFFSIFDSKISAYYRTFPDWVFIGVAIIFFAGFLLSFYWGITGVAKGQRLLNIAGIGSSLLGLGMYVLAFVVHAGSGKEIPGQFDHNINNIETAQQAALHTLLQQTHTKPTDVQFVPYWGMHKNKSGFVVCIQKGNIIALQVKDKALDNVSNISKLQHLNWLVLEHCGLKSIATLDLPMLERLSINNNQLTTLNGVQHSPKIGWLDFSGNPVTDSSALQQLHHQHLVLTSNQ